MRCLVKSMIFWCLKKEFLGIRLSHMKSVLGWIKTPQDTGGFRWLRAVEAFIAQVELSLAWAGWCHGMEGVLPSGVVHQLRRSLCQADSLSSVGWTSAECPALLERDGGFRPLVRPLLQSSPREAEGRACSLARSEQQSHSEDFLLSSLFSGSCQEGSRLL